ncbi:hypothetical protein [Marinospirillum perlucidum]|uniref:hypothetical protein n=1 Tax=Marinospirillum perlucidum TaxID=1982602 RepID=UPI0013901A87|nr:hypothetical protein [Marinospirillum perlucidum]
MPEASVAGSIAVVSLEALSVDSEPSSNLMMSISEIEQFKNPEVMTTRDDQFGVPRTWLRSVGGDNPEIDPA